jgi:uracil phosphoribosyltransferase
MRANPSQRLVVIDHPLVTHKLSLLRDKTTPSAQFRQLLREISLLLGYEVLRDLPVEMRAIETPIGPTSAPFLKGKKLVFVPILRAGSGLLDGLLELVPSARVGHVGLYRDPLTLQAIEYYAKLPDNLAERLVVVVDPMLATGNSAVAAISRLKAAGAARIRLLCLLGAPEGIAAMARAHPDVPVFIAAIDERLDDHGYIVPGLGDAGDRLYGTK